MKTTLLSRAVAAALLAALLILPPSARPAATLTPAKPADAYFEGFEPAPAPAAAALLQKGDRLAICGDSITEQKMYSRIMETYLTVCVPEMEITVRQYGWSGEQAPGFLARMTNDCLRFHPTVATTCYGMNDHRYQPYTDEIGGTYRKYSTAIVEAFKANNVRVVLGSPGCVGKMPSWVRSANGTVRDLNLNLCKLRNIDIDLADKEQVGFADVFWPMFTAGFEAQKRYGPDFAIAGKDGVHPGWAGQLVMAYAFLKGLGVDGSIGTVTLDLASGQAAASAGHEIVSSKNGEVQIKSSRYPFCATGDTNNDGSIRAGMALVPFNQELNRFVLAVKNPAAQRYKVTWGTETKSYPAAQLVAGVNLADEFAANPFSAAFAKVDAAVAAKQAYETKQVKTIFHGILQYNSRDVNGDREARKIFGEASDLVAADTEKTRAPLAAAIKEAFVPVVHTVRVEAE